MTGVCSGCRRYLDLAEGRGSIWVSLKVGAVLFSFYGGSYTS